VLEERLRSDIRRAYVFVQGAPYYLKYFLVG